MEKGKTIDISKMSFSEMNVELDHGFMDAYTRASLEDAVARDPNKTNKNTPKIIDTPHPDAKKRDKGEPPKPQDIIEAMYQNILIKYTYEATRWFFDTASDSVQNFYTKKKAELAEITASQDTENTDTFKFSGQLNKSRDKSIKEAKDQETNFNGFVEMGDMIRQGRVDEIEPNLMNDQAKNFIKNMDPDYRNQLFSEDNVEQAQKTFLNHERTADTFAAQIASAYLAEERMHNPNDDKWSNLSEDDIKQSYQEQFKAAKEMFYRDIDDAESIGINPQERVTHLMGLAGDISSETDKNIKKGNFNEMGKKLLGGEKYKGNKYLDELKLDIMSVNQKAAALPQNKRVGLREESVARNFSDKMIGHTTRNLLSDENLLGAERARIEKTRDDFNKKVNRGVERNFNFENFKNKGGR